jgi:hypothetical protein
MDLEPASQELDQQVKQTLEELEPAGQPASVETVTRTLRQRTADVLSAMKRVAGVGPSEPDADTSPERYPSVVAAEQKMTAIAAAIYDAERTLTERESLLARAEAQAAVAVADGLEAPSLVPARQAVQAAAETMHLLQLAQVTAKDRYTEALAAAEAKHQQAVWRRFQALLATHLVAARSTVESWESLRAYCAQHGWAFGLQPFNGTMEVMAESWVPHVEALLAQEAPSSGGGTVVTGGQPRAY